MLHTLHRPGFLCLLNPRICGGKDKDNQLHPKRPSRIVRVFDLLSSTSGKRTDSAHAPGLEASRTAPRERAQREKKTEMA